MILTLEITALVSMIIITSIVVAGFIIFISFCSRIKKQNILLSELIETLKIKNNTIEKKDVHIQTPESDDCNITSNNIKSIK